MFQTGYILWHSLIRSYIPFAYGSADINSKPESSQYIPCLGPEKHMICISTDRDAGTKTKSNYSQVATTELFKIAQNGRLGNRNSPQSVLFRKR